jgi:hypothetical protein
MRKLMLASTIVAMSLLSNGMAIAQVSPAFAQGLNDRQSWESWFNSQTGDYQAGAFFWSGQRSQLHPAPCYAQGGRDLGAWSAGCVAAQQRLALADVRRKGEPDYRTGWNAWVPNSSRAPSVATSAPNHEAASTVTAPVPSIPTLPTTAPIATPVQQPVVIAHLASAAASTSTVPNDEEGVIQIVQAAIRQYRDGQNDMQKGAARPMRAQSICRILSNPPAARGWIGVVTTLSTNGDGKGVLAVQLSDNTYVTTWNNDLSDIADDTLIDPQSSLYQTVSQLHKGQKVKFSGSFASSTADCLKESSLTMSGSISEPEFIIRFESVTPIE